MTDKSAIFTDESPEVFRKFVSACDSVMDLVSLKSFGWFGGDQSRLIYYDIILL